MIIAIDGPAASGKSTVAKMLATKLKMFYIDTGAMYRALTLKALKKGVDAEDGRSITKLARGLNIELKKGKGDRLKVFLDGKDVTEDIRGKDVDRDVSLLSAHLSVRRYMVTKQRNLCKDINVVVEGRDIGTKVFPDADKKFYLDASLYERARRRQLEEIDRGEMVDIFQVEQELVKRDRMDSTRKNSPLLRAKDAIVIDTTHLDVKGVVKKMLDVIL